MDYPQLSRRASRLAHALAGQHTSYAVPLLKITLTAICIGTGFVGGEVTPLFVMGATAFPQNAGYNPTGTVGALAYWAADAIRTQYLKAPGPLVHA